MAIKSYSLVLLSLFFSALVFGQEYEVNGTYVYSNFPSGSDTTKNGNAYGGYRRNVTIAPITIIFHDTDGDGNVWAKLHHNWNSGSITGNATTSGISDYGIQPDGYTVTAPTTAFVFSIFHSGSGSSYHDAIVPYGETQEFVSSFGGDFGLHGTTSGTSTDYVNLAVVVNFEVENGQGGSSSLIHNWVEPVTINLYEGGVLPSGGRPPFTPTSSGYDTDLSGTITNDSDTAQTLELWANTGPNGEPELQSSVTVEPGASIPYELGSNLGSGLSGYLVSSGEVIGGPSSGTVTGNNSGIDLSFPDQAKQDVKIIFDNGDFLPLDISLGSETAPQQYISIPPGNSVHEVKLSTGGTILVNGADILQTVLNQQGGTTLIAQAPPGSGGSVNQTASATVTGAGGTVTTNVYELPSGNSVSVSTGPLDTSSPASPAVTGGPSSAGTVSSSSSPLVDEAAAQIAAIRAELAASAELKSQEVEALGEVSQESANGIQTNIDGIIAATDPLIDGIGEGDFLFFDDVAPQPVQIGQETQIQIPWRGETVTVDLDFPGRVFFRSALLVLAMVGIFMKLLAFSKV